MTTYNRSLTLATGGGNTITQNVTTADSVVVTVSVPGNYFISSISTSNCSSNKSSMVAGSSNTITFSSTGSYTCTYFASSGGKNPTIYSGQVSGTVSSTGSTGSAPVISSVTNNNASAANVTATVNLSSNGSGGTLQYAQTSSNSAPSSGWQSGNTFSHPRGTTRYYWARQSSSLVSSSESHAVGYIAPDTTVSPSNVTLTSSATSGTTTISNVTSGETYQVRNNAGSVTYVQVTASSSSVNATISSGLPTEGNSDTFRIYAKRPTNMGGDDAYDDTGDTFTITRSAFSGNTFLVNVTASGSQESGQTFLVVGLTGNGVSESSGSPKQIAAGDRVGFKLINNNTSVVTGGTVTGFASTHWTNTTTISLTSSYQYKIAKSGIDVSNFDEVTIQVTGTNNASQNKNIYFIGASTDPDLSVTIGDSSIEISSTATTFTQTIVNSGSTTNANITEYRIIDTDGVAHESRTGHGSITVTDVPPNAGFPKSYSVQARVTTANGGSGNFIGISGTSFSVIATTTQTNNTPTIDAHGIAIFDNAGNIVSSFTEGHTVLREIFTGNTTLSTSSTVDVNTGLTGITTSNCIITVEGDNTSQGTTGAINVPATFVTVSGTIRVRLGRHTSALGVKVTVSQHKGLTIGASSNNYGWQIKNGDADTVIDENSVVYGVKETIAINPSASNQTLYTNDQTNFIYLNLTQGRYPASAGLPIPALACSKSVAIIPPFLTGIKHADGSYRTVLCYLPKQVAATNFTLAMLVPSDVATPEYFGGSDSNYGVKVYNSSGSLIWDSGWKQAIVNNVISANQFTQGVNQNGTYDVTTGRDGVNAPAATESVLDAQLETTAEVKGITGLNQMDPANTFVGGLAVTGRVHYNRGLFNDAEHNIQQDLGGGLHIPACRINSTTSASITMFRYASGLTDTSNRGQRVSTSYHPEGHFVLFRIV